MSSRMNFSMSIESPKKGNNLPWLMVILAALAMGLAAWMLEPTIIHAWRLG